MHRFRYFVFFDRKRGAHIGYRIQFLPAHRFTRGAMRRMSRIGDIRSRISGMKKQRRIFLRQVIGTLAGDSGLHPDSFAAVWIKAPLIRSSAALS